MTSVLLSCVPSAHKPTLGTACDLEARPFLSRALACLASQCQFFHVRGLLTPSHLRGRSWPTPEREGLTLYSVSPALHGFSYLITTSSPRRWLLGFLFYQRRNRGPESSISGSCRKFCSNNRCLWSGVNSSKSNLALPPPPQPLPGEAPRLRAAGDKIPQLPTDPH